MAEGLVARAANAANAGRDEKPEAGQLATDEPMPEWERELLQPAGDAPAEAPAAEAPAAEAPAAEAPAAEAPAAEAPAAVATETA